MIYVNSRLTIRLFELEITYVRSSGPGGQNVNKVNSKAVVRWSILSSASLEPSDRELLLLRLAPQLTQDGELIVTSDRFRDQGRNREDCFEKIQTRVAKALTRAPIRKKTKPSRQSRRKRADSKRKHSAKKKLRSGRNYD